MNWTAIKAIYVFEMARFFRTFLQSLISPVISTSLYFVVSGAAIGSRIDQVDGVSYGAFIVPGLVMLTVMTQSISNASFGIYFPKFIGTIYELLSAPISFFRDRSGLCWRSCDQGDVHRRYHLDYLVFLRQYSNCTPHRDGSVPCPDLYQLFTIWLYHRHLGKEF